VAPKERLVRFVLGPDGTVFPDVAGQLPGRGMWVTAGRAELAKAVKTNAFARAAKASAKIPEGLVDLVERLLADRVSAALGMARRAGAAVSGFEEVRDRLRRGKLTKLLVAASDGAENGRAKLRALAPELPIMDVLSGAEIGVIFGRDYVVHAAVAPGGLADRLMIDAVRLGGFRGTAAKAMGDAAAGRTRPAPGK
jgi:predicted RNA-binding protein YlxR (DUF448 family)